MKVAIAQLKPTLTKLNELSQKKALTIERFPDRTVESSPLGIKFMSDVKKWEAKLEEMNAEFAEHDKEVEKLDVIEKNYPPSSEDDYKILYCLCFM